MITPDEFAMRWEQGEQELARMEPHYVPSPLSNAEAWMLKDKPISAEVKKFLIHAGLPSSAAPFLTFEHVEEGLPPIWNMWGSIGDWSEGDILRLKRYYLVGQDGNGNAICIDTENKEYVVLLDHEDNFRTSQFVNSSVFHLAECLLSYRERMNNRKNTEQVKREFGRTDVDAIGEGNFWAYQIKDLEWLDANPDD